MKTMRMRRDADGTCYLQQVRRPPTPSWLDRGGTVVGDVRLHDIPSAFTGRTRRVLVYLPPFYSEHDPWRYPVIYLHDGQNVFDAKTSAFGVEWGADEAAEDLIQKRRIQPLIMVAVYNTPKRMEEYTPTRDARRGGGEGAVYGRFLVEELKPFIDSHYKTSRNASETAILGSSLGGLSALYLGWNHPQVFGVVAALSPSLWWSGRDLVSAIAGDPRERGPSRIWMDVGTAESDEDGNGNGIPDVLDDLRMLKAVLMCKGYQLEQDLFYREIDGATHSEECWGRRIGQVLETLFPVRAEKLTIS